MLYGWFTVTTCHSSFKITERLSMTSSVKKGMMQSMATRLHLQETLSGAGAGRWLLGSALQAHARCRPFSAALQGFGLFLGQVPPMPGQHLLRLHLQLAQVA